MEPLNPNPTYPFVADAEVESAYIHKDGAGRVTAISLRLVYYFTRKRLVGGTKRLPISGRVVPEVELTRDTIRLAVEVVEDRIGPFLPFVGGGANAMIGLPVRVGGIPFSDKKEGGQLVFHLRGALAYPLYAEEEDD